MDTYPEMKRWVKSFLEAGVFEGFARNEEDLRDVKSNEIGTPQGGPLSSLLCNIALDGLGKALKESRGALWQYNYAGIRGVRLKVVHRGVWNREAAVKRTVFARFVDDFVIMHDNPETLKYLKVVAERWLAPTGLKFNEEKTKIVDMTQEGLDFLGFHLFQKSRPDIKSMGAGTGTLRGYHRPSDKNVENLKRKFKVALGCLGTQPRTHAR